MHNTALMSAQYPESFETLSARPAEWGRWVESAVGAHLLNAMLNSDLKLLYWRHSNNEVDFVLQKGENVIGIEVKSGSGKRTGGMQAFSKKYSPEKVLLVGDDGLPWQEFLELKPNELF